MKPRKYTKKQIKNNIVVSKHVVFDRHERLDKRWNQQELERLLRAHSKISWKTPQQVHQGQNKSYAWAVLDSGKSKMFFPLVLTNDQSFLATTVITRKTNLKGIFKIYKRIIVR